jgi:chemotaxis protein methyltransferase CheR
MKNHTPAMPPSDFNYIRDLIREHAALTLEPGKEYLVESRLNPLARQEGFNSYGQMVQSLRVGPFRDLHRKVVEAMTINETSFFRDARLFGMLSKTILPTLISQRSSQRSLNIWCAACSTGQEPYSLAMLLREYRPSLAGWDINIVASDISRDVLVRARSGRYSQIEINRGLPSPLLVKYFEQRNSAWEIHPDVQRMVEFREINLIKPWPRLRTMHLIFMRNVLIYFDVDTRKDILERAGRLLDPEGFLFLGGAETTASLDDSFEPVSNDGAVCFRRRSNIRARTQSSAAPNPR